MFRYGRVKRGSADNVVSFGPDVVRIWYVGSATAQVLKPRFRPRLYWRLRLPGTLRQVRLNHATLALEKASDVFSLIG
jgi:hypothetical protein